MDATSLGLPKPELTDGGTTTTERQAYKDAWDAQIETADANILSAIGTGGGQVDTAANFTASNPTLNEDQFGYESDTGKFKLGDGATAWNSLAYYFDGTSGSGDVTGGSASTDGEVVVYNGGTGKAVKRSNTLTGIAKVTAGVLGVCSNLDDVTYEAAANKGQANGYAPLDGDSLVPTENLPAGMGSGDVLGSGTPVVGDPVKATNVDGKHIGPATRTYYNAVDHGSAVVHASNDIGATFRAWIAGLSNCVVVFPPCAAGTYYNFTTDLSFPESVQIVISMGAIFKTGIVAVSETVTNAFTAGHDGTITVNLNSPYVLGSGTTFYNDDLTVIGGAWIKTQAGNYYRIYHRHSDTVAYLAEMPVAQEIGATYKYSNNILTGSGALSELQVGDYVYITGLTDPVVISKISGSTAYTYDFVPEEVSGAAATRGVRVTFNDHLDAGNYKIFTGTGVYFINAQKNPFVIPEWWGAIADGDVANAADNTYAINKAGTCFIPQSTYPAAGEVRLSGGRYVLADSILMVSAITGTGMKGYYQNTILECPATCFDSPGYIRTAWGAQQYGTTNSGPRGWKVKGITFEGNFKGGASYLPQIGVYHNAGGYADIEDNLFLNLGWNYICQAGNVVHIKNNGQQGCFNGYQCTSLEGEVSHNWGTFGLMPVSQYDFSGSSAWSQTAADWSFAGSVATKTAGTTNALWQTIEDADIHDLTLWPSAWLYIEIRAVRGAGNGTFSLNVCGQSVATNLCANQDTTTPFIKRYVYHLDAEDIWPITTTKLIEFVPNTDFDGYIKQAVIAYGIGCENIPTTFNDNDLWSDVTNGVDASTVYIGAVGFSTSNIRNHAVNNHIHPAAIGALIFDGGGHLSINCFDSCMAGLYLQNTVANSVKCKDNSLLNYSFAGIWNDGPGDLAEITGNTVISSVTGSPVPTYTYVGEGNWVGVPIIENNIGIDKGSTILISGATPSVNWGANFKTDNSSPTTITNFVGNYAGKVIKVLVNDSNTTFDFTGTNLKGNGAADFVGQSGDLLTFVGDGTNWHGTISSIH